jgi:hypothetical protein
MRKFFFNLLGQWAAALRQGGGGSGGSSGGGGGILGAIGGLLGIGGLGGSSGGGAGVGSGPYGLPPGIAMSFGGGEFGGLSWQDVQGGGSSSNSGSSIPIILSTPVGGASSGVPDLGELEGCSPEPASQSLGLWHC